MVDEAQRGVAAGEVPRERVLRVFLSNPQRAREVGWVAQWGIDGPYTPQEYVTALDDLRAAWVTAGDEYDRLLSDARERCTAIQWADLRALLTIETGVDPGPQEGVPS